MVIGHAEYEKYKPTSSKIVYEKTPVEWGISGGARGTGYYMKPKVVYTTPPDPVRIQRKTLFAELLTAPKNVILGIGDANGGDGRGTIDRSAYFRAGKYDVYGGLPEYYQEKVHELPSREQFVSEGGLFGEPTIATMQEDGLVDTEGMYGDAEPTNWIEIALIISGLILLFVLGVLL